MSDKKQLPTWDLEAIYPTTKAWEEDFAKLKGLAEACLAFKFLRHRLIEPHGNLYTLAFGRYHDTAIEIVIIVT